MLTLVIIRAYGQSITIDEADSFMIFVVGEIPWEANSGNHVLNTVLVRLAVSIFGVSEFAVRLPAIAGSILFSTAAVRLAEILLPAGGGRRVAFLGCLLLNPMTLDLLVAARGYSLALGFYAWAVCLLLANGEGWQKRAALVSACCGASIAANFSFAFASAALCLVGFALGLREHRPSTLAALVKWGAVCFLPCAGVALFFCSWAFMHWSAAEMVYGATTVAESLRSLSASSLSKVNPAVLNPHWAAAVQSLQSMLPYGWALALTLAFTVPVFESLKGRRPSRAFVILAATLATVVLMHVTMHWAAGLLLPKQRTGLFFILLCTALLATAMPGGGTTSGRSVARYAVLTVSVLTCLSFISCLRLHHFDEWPWNADTREGYEVLECLVDHGEVAAIATEWRFRGAMSFYRHASARPIKLPAMAAITDEASEACVLYDVDAGPILEKRGLVDLRHWRPSGMMIAVPRGSVAARSGCGGL